MNILKFMSLAFMAVLISSCGSKKSSEESSEDLFNSEETEVSTKAETVEEDNSSSSSENWDSLLDSYDEYVEKYIDLMKKATSGDMDALKEYPALLQKAQEFYGQMQNAQDQMSVSQWKRFNEITNKKIEAIKNLQE